MGGRRRPPTLPMAWSCYSTRCERRCGAVLSGWACGARDVPHDPRRRGELRHRGLLQLRRIITWRVSHCSFIIRRPTASAHSLARSATRASSHLSRLHASQHRNGVCDGRFVLALRHVLLETVLRRCPGLCNKSQGRFAQTKRCAEIYLWGTRAATAVEHRLAERGA